MSPPRAYLLRLQHKQNEKSHLPGSVVRSLSFPKTLTQPPFIIQKPKPTRPSHTTSDPLRPIQPISIIQLHLAVLKSRRSEIPQEAPIDNLKICTPKGASTERVVSNDKRIVWHAGGV